jgi:acylphosphatase
MGTMTDDTVRRRVTIRGDVQGVFFRETTRRMATEAGVSGWVTNRRDGTVEAVFEGAAEAVEQLVEFCREGPTAATVERVDVREEPPEALSGFEVR